MTLFIALLRGVNLGGSTTLPMADLKAWATEAGFANPRTYIASGNLLFESDLSEPAAKAALEAILKQKTGRSITAVLRTAAQMRAVLEANPFAGKSPTYTVAIFLDQSPEADAAVTATGGQAGEEVRLGQREIYAHYPAGQGRSKLRIPAAKDGTARNMNTVGKLVDLAGR